MANAPKLCCLLSLWLCLLGFALDSCGQSSGFWRLFFVWSLCSSALPWLLPCRVESACGGHRFDSLRQIRHARCFSELACLCLSVLSNSRSRRRLARCIQTQGDLPVSARRVAPGRWLPLRRIVRLALLQLPSRLLLCHLCRSSFRLSRATLRKRTAASSMPLHHYHQLHHPA